MTLGAMTTTTQAYGEPEYWDNRYAQDTGPFDWYQKYPALAPLLHLYIPTKNRILVVGCGNAAFSEGMVKDGYEDIFNIDISSVVIEAMQKKYQECHELKYIEMDVRDMNNFTPGYFDAVLDKGTLDSLMCGHNSQQNASKMLEEVWRVLKDNGVYILITYGAPVYRLSLLKNTCSWKILLHVIEKPMTERSPDHKHWALTNPISLDDDGSSVDAALGRNPEVHYIYVCTKKDEFQRLGSKHEINC